MMNRLFLLLPLMYTIIIARPNPFEPAIEPNTPLHIEMEPIKMGDGNRTVKIINSNEGDSGNIIQNTPKVLEVTKNNIITKIDNVEEKNNTIIQNIQIEEKFVEKSFSPLPFLNLILKKNELHIQSKEKYKLKKMFTLPSENKIVLDFHGKVKHYTKKDSFESKFFESFVIGNHPAKNFFRIVIKTKYNTTKYTSNSSTNLVTIMYNK